ncbi:ribosome assembly RNA-binding protein YhbY, partial [Methylobacterium sp. WL103]
MQLGRSRVAPRMPGCASARSREKRPPAAPGGIGSPKGPEARARRLPRPASGRRPGSGRGPPPASGRRPA